MRLIAILTAAAFLLPATISAGIAQSGYSAVQSTDLSAARKKMTKKKKQPKEEYLKAAPGTGPSGPKL